jgi:hypothetical protein
MSSMSVQFLERCLLRAKENAFTTVAILATGFNGNWEHHFSGSYNQTHEKLMLDCAKDLQTRLQNSLSNAQPPFEGWSVDLSYACFNCCTSPASYDFLTWLIIQEMRRVESFSPAPLKVAFWKGHDSSAQLGHRHPMERHEHWIEHVYRPILRLIGAVEDECALDRMGLDAFLTKHVCNMHALHMPLPKLKPVKDYDLPKGVITITLREVDDPFFHRNSNIKEWGKFAKWLRDEKGEQVVWVRDTRVAEGTVSGFDTCPLASTDLDARFWLYQNAKLNCFVSNGPMMLCVFSDFPYIAFVPPEEEDSDYIANTPNFWKLKMGVSVGEQFPWAKPSQKIVWTKDTFEAMKTAYQFVDFAGNLK